MCSPSYQLNGFAENHGLGTCCMVKTWSPVGQNDFMIAYIHYGFLLLQDLINLCVVDHLWALFALTYNHFHNILRLFDALTIFPQLKQSAIITYADGMYELPNELLIDLKLKILAN